MMTVTDIGITGVDTQMDEPASETDETSHEVTTGDLGASTATTCTEAITTGGEQFQPRGPDARAKRHLSCDMSDITLICFWRHDLRHMPTRL